MKKKKMNLFKIIIFCFVFFLLVFSIIKLVEGKDRFMKSFQDPLNFYELSSGNISDDTLIEADFNIIYDEFVIDIFGDVDVAIRDSGYYYTIPFLKNHYIGLKMHNLSTNRIPAYKISVHTHNYILGYEKLSSDKSVNVVGYLKNINEIKNKELLEWFETENFVNLVEKDRLNKKFAPYIFIEYSPSLVQFNYMIFVIIFIFGTFYTIKFIMQLFHRSKVKKNHENIYKSTFNQEIQNDTFNKQPIINQPAVYKEEVNEKKIYLEQESVDQSKIYDEKVNMNQISSEQKQSDYEEFCSYPESKENTESSSGPNISFKREGNKIHYDEYGDEYAKDFNRGIYIEK